MFLSVSSAGCGRGFGVWLASASDWGPAGLWPVFVWNWCRVDRRSFGAGSATVCRGGSDYRSTGVLSGCLRGECGWRGCLALVAYARRGFGWGRFWVMGTCTIGGDADPARNRPPAAPADADDVRAGWVVLRGVCCADGCAGEDGRRGRGELVRSCVVA